MLQTVWKRRKKRKNKIDELNKREGKNKNKDSFKHTKKYTQELC